ncbi:hypothetical protein DMN91_008901 [Ooceraea biroi]|uniref:Reverse transcriptase n=2 Tax=Ooceraea biroi TaxID=2015173 RepID=A0A3L8DDS1_OOCBI|nr:hypothetical protein DMN91_008901 [Ooceraea biroi]
MASIQRRAAIRVVHGYRTISHEAAGVLAGLRREGAALTDRAVETLRRQARRRTTIKWRRRLTEPSAATQRAVGVVLPVLEDWVDRGWGSLSYHTTQVLTGHGCFGEYLYRIGKEATTHCHHCGGDRDTAQHTLEECPSWAEERRVLVTEIGEDLSLPAVIKNMVGSERAWNSMASCSQVMRQKEAAERERERVFAPGRIR